MEEARIFRSGLQVGGLGVNTTLISQCVAMLLVVPTLASWLGLLKSFKPDIGKVWGTKGKQDYLVRAVKESDDEPVDSEGVNILRSEYGLFDDGRTPEQRDRAEELFKQRDQATIKALLLEIGYILSKYPPHITEALLAILPDAVKDRWYAVNAMHGGFSRNCLEMVEPMNLSWRAFMILAFVVTEGVPKLVGPNQGKKDGMIGKKKHSGGHFQVSINLACINPGGA